MDAHVLAQDLLVVYVTGLAMVVALARVRVPPVVALVLSGVLIGRSGFGLVADPSHVEELAELGIILLLFTVGLDFSATALARIWRTVLAGGAFQLLCTTAVGAGVVVALGLTSPATAVFLGLFMAMSSTAVAIRALADRNEVDAPHGRLTVGVLLLQDLAIVGALMLVPVLGGQVAPREVPLLLGRAVVALVAVGVIGRLVLPPLVRVVLRARRREVFPFALLLASAGTAWLCARLGLPTAVGAFFGGLVLAESEFSHQAQAEIGPLRDLLASLFFVSLGLMVNVHVMAAHLGLLPLVVGAVLAGKALIAAGGFALIRQPLGVAVGAGLALAQVGEFSFIVGREGLAVGLIDQGTWQLLLAASIATMLLTPGLLALRPGLVALIGRLAGRPGAAAAAAGEAARGHVLILGFGLGGRLIAAALRVAERPYAVMDLNGRTVLAARAAGEPIDYGDAASPDALAGAGAAEAAAVAIVLNDPESTRRAVRAVRNVSPDVPVVARTRYRLEAERLMAAGATAVAVEEIETSIEVLGMLLARLSVPPDRVKEMLEYSRRAAQGAEPEGPAPDGR